LLARFRLLPACLGFISLLCLVLLVLLLSRLLEFSGPDPEGPRELRDPSGPEEQEDYDQDNYYLQSPIGIMEGLLFFS
jgi:hypothetical protein